jgi:hypothetical protein
MAFVLLIQSQRIVTTTVKHGTATARLYFDVFVPTQTKSTQLTPQCTNVTNRTFDNR